MARFKPEVARRPAPLIEMNYDGWGSIRLCRLTGDYVFMNSSNECENCHAPAGTVCSDMDCPGKKPSNEPAFPRDHQSDGHNGMSLRDYFAAKAMHGLMDAAVPMPEIAEAAYQMADLMMVARGK